MHTSSIAIYVLAIPAIATVVDGCGFIVIVEAGELVEGDGLIIST